MCKFSGEATLSFSFLVHFSMRNNSLKKEFAHREQILPFQSIPQFEGSCFTRERNGESQKLFPFVKMAGKHGSVPIHLKINQGYQRSLVLNMFWCILSQT